jgi:hypothetical protein
MNWQQAKAQARRLVDEAIVSGSAMNLTEYQSKDRYEIDHPNDRPIGAHNAVVRAAPKAGIPPGTHDRWRVESRSTNVHQTPSCCYFDTTIEQDRD